MSRLFLSSPSLLVLPLLVTPAHGTPQVLDRLGIPPAFNQPMGGAVQSPTTPENSSAVMLHIAPVQGDACASGPKTSKDIVTHIEIGHGGADDYLVYLLASPATDEVGLAGLAVGVEYDDPAPKKGVKVHEWKSCSDLEFPFDTWPASGSGDIITWDVARHCQTAPIVVAGYFTVSVYSPATMALAAYPPDGDILTADCSVAVAIPSRSVNLSRVGWISMGGGKRGTDSDGCNPLEEPCDQSPTATEPATWGDVKSRYR